MAVLESLAQVDQWRDYAAVVTAAGSEDWEGLRVVLEATEDPRWLTATLARSLWCELERNGGAGRGSAAQFYEALRRGLAKAETELLTA